MAWNEESDNKQDKDPWGKNGNQGPPDLDEIVKKMQKGIGGIFGNKPTKKGDTPVFPFLIAIILLVAWLIFDMTYLIDQQLKGVVLRLVNM